ncbi:cupin domain-containing protein [Pseudooceanicola algae]|uniref:Cupin type-2 domain-containing protein n=1 Tax=Pseudooceanicola algae TaxID=1537215 RepID=A0A418SIT7_9RHOB|nr:cupin domain-containing protein [Pseudooceanicola algae]QPM91144.1 hypothetical protein PSAL_023930 [Pseudooceanicola algae]
MTMKALCIAALTVSAFAGPAGADDYPPLDVLVSSSQTVIGQPFAYPEGVAKITAAIVSMQPGQTTGLHHHDAPLFAYILEGEITVDYGADGKKTYRAGDAVIEAFGSVHEGENTGAGPMRLLAVFAGSDQAANTLSE